MAAVDNIKAAYARLVSAINTVWAKLTQVSASVDTLMPVQVVQLQTAFTSAAVQAGNSLANSGVTFTANGGVFNGSSYLQITNAKFATGKDDRRFDFEITPATIAGNQYLIDFGGNIGCVAMNAGKLNFYNPVLGIGSALYTNGPRLTAGTPYKISIRLESGTITAYCNDVSWGTAADAYNYVGTVMTVGNYGGLGPYYFNGTFKSLSFITTNQGITSKLSNLSNSFYFGGSYADQVLSAGVLTYITGSAIPFPASGLTVDSLMEWVTKLSKTAAGTAASTYVIKVGTTGTVSDTTVATFTKPAGTAAADTGTAWFGARVRTKGASGVLSCWFQMTHDLAATGFLTKSNADPAIVVTSAIDLTVPNLKIGLAFTTGAAEVVTVKDVQSLGFKLCTV